MKIKKPILLLFKKGTKPLLGHRLARFYPIKVIFNFLLLLLNNFKVIGEIQGNKIFLGSKVSFLLFIEGGERPFETEIFKQQINRGDVVLDLGANVGYYTLIAAKLVGENGKVFAFEPDPANFSLLKRNVELNNYRNVILIQKAISNKTGKCKLYLCKENSTSNRIYASADWESVEVETIRLDDYFKNYNRKVNFIKMDIEGSEGLALQGMLSLLQKNKNLKIFTEFNPLALKNCGVRPEGYLTSLLKQGFRLNHINEQKQKVYLTTIDELIQKYPDEEYTNLLCLR